jgi:antitoxin FitA
MLRDAALDGGSPALPATSAWNTMHAGVLDRELPPMATLTVRDVDPRLKERLRVRAARNGRSMEAELRHILGETLGREATDREPNLAEAIRRRFAPLGGVELAPHPPVPVGEPPRLG